MKEEMRRIWLDLLGTWSVAPAVANPVFDDLCLSYAATGRFYHTLDHIRDVLTTVDHLSSHAEHPDAVRLAAWFHDVIYDSRASDNEERSAEYAEGVCIKLAIPEGPRVASLILKTKTHVADCDPDAQVLLDADLAILGADEATYQNYARNIRLEYGWVPEDHYRIGRRQVLQNFLTRPKIYAFLNDREEVARRNLAMEISSLR